MEGPTLRRHLIGTRFGNMEAVVTEEGLSSLRFVDMGPDPPGRLPALEMWLSGYFSGKDPGGLDMPLDLSGSTPFQRRIYGHLAEVPFGSCASYKELGEMAGFHGSPRAVGGAVGANPILIVIPCHRVLAKGPKGGYRLGGFSAGLDPKRKLLELEGLPNLPPIK
jgi:O-6-methylguanine DNA methyltransferase